MIIPSEYMRILSDSGISLDLLNPGSDEIALNRDAALLALRSLSGSAISVLGGDVLKWNGSVLEYAYANWHCSKLPEESLSEYAKRSLQEANTYISEFKSATDFEPLFVVVLNV